MEENRRNGGGKRRKRESILEVSEGGKQTGIQRKLRKTSGKTDSAKERMDGEKIDRKDDRVYVSGQGLCG